MPAVNVAPAIYETTGQSENPYLPKDRPNRDVRSNRMKAKEMAGGGAFVVNTCPFGCPDEELDASGYCKHVVGDTKPGDDRIYFPRKHRRDSKGRLQEHVFTDGKDPREVLPTDHLVAVSVNHLVYREEGLIDEPEVELSEAKPKKTKN